MDFTLETHLVVKYGDQTWALTQVTVDDVIYFQFGKWDRGFVKWVTGKSLDLRKDKTAGSADCRFLDQLIARRQTACDDALDAALHHDDDESSQVKKRRRRAKSSDDHLVPKVHWRCLSFFSYAWVWIKMISPTMDGFILYDLYDLY